MTIVLIKYDTLLIVFTSAEYTIFPTIVTQVIHMPSKLLNCIKWMRSLLCGNMSSYNVVNLNTTIFITHTYVSPSTYMRAPTHTYIYSFTCFGESHYFHKSLNFWFLLCISDSSLYDVSTKFDLSSSDVAHSKLPDLFRTSQLTLHWDVLNELGLWS